GALLHGVQQLLAEGLGGLEVVGIRQLDLILGDAPAVAFPATVGRAARHEGEGDAPAALALSLLLHLLLEALEALERPALLAMSPTRILSLEVLAGLAHALRDLTHLVHGLLVEDRRHLLH